MPYIYSGTRWSNCGTISLQLYCYPIDADRCSNLCTISTYPLLFSMIWMENTYNWNVFVNINYYT